MTPDFIAEWQRRYDARMAALRTPPAKALIEMSAAELRQEIERRLAVGMADVMEQYDREQEEIIMHGDPLATGRPRGLLSEFKSERCTVDDIESALFNALRVVRRRRSERQ